MCLYEKKEDIYIKYSSFVIIQLEKCKRPAPLTVGIKVTRNGMIKRKNK